MIAQTVLIVDDNEAILELFEIAFKQAGFNVLTALSGHRALSILNEQPVDIITLDHDMPRMTGYDVLKILRKHDDLHDTKIIMVTANTIIASDTEINDLADLTLLKPISFSQLIQLANRLLMQATSKCR